MQQTRPILEKLQSAVSQSWIAPSGYPSLCLSFRMFCKSPEKFIECLSPQSPQDVQEFWKISGPLLKKTCVTLVAAGLDLGEIDVEDFVSLDSKFLEEIANFLEGKAAERQLAGY